MTNVKLHGRENTQLMLAVCEASCRVELLRIQCISVRMEDI